MPFQHPEEVGYGYVIERYVTGKDSDHPRYRELKSGRALRPGWPHAERFAHHLINDATTITDAELGPPPPRRPRQHPPRQRLHPARRPLRPVSGPGPPPRPPRLQPPPSSAAGWASAGTSPVAGPIRGHTSPPPGGSRPAALERWQPRPGLQGPYLPAPPAAELPARAKSAHNL
ncbi:DUF6000 family protein [Streptomyces sp. NPDC127039]|uniref:DUF6000 family protein n=1 Tax=Streptomyces sp. NPDC127039 TaxID=3347115 RepID=UPI00365AD475